MPDHEAVLCIKKDALPLSWISPRTILNLGIDEFIVTCSKAGFEFLNRKMAEKNSAYKQIIPYIILQTRDKRKIAAYNRHGSEKRLHDLWSIGIGGHINPIDGNQKDVSFQQLLLTGMKRELSEELIKMPANDSPVFTGVIGEELTEVGKVHLGAVFTILTDHPHEYVPGKELDQFHWADVNTISDFNLELWSTIALDLI